MAENSTSQSRLTVLTGPLAGKELVLEDSVDNILIGSDAACRFHLPTPGVDAIHARLWMDASGVTVYDTQSSRGLYVNDDRVNGQAPLRNGDILWLGTPGDDDVVMIQCRLPMRSSAAASAPTPTPVPEPQTGAEETMLLVNESEPTIDVHGAAHEELPATVYETVSDELPEVAPEEPVLEVVGDETQAMPPDEFAIDETAALAPQDQPTEAFSADEGFPFPPPAAAPHVPFEDETDEMGTIAMPAPEPPPMEPTVSMPLPEPEPPASDEAPTLMAPPPAPTPIPTPPAVEPPPPPKPPPAPRPAPAAAAPRPRPAPMPREPRPAPAPRGKKAAASSSGGSGLYVGLGVVGLLVLAVGGYFGWQFMQGSKAPAVAPSAAPATTMAAVPAQTLPPETTPPETTPEAPPSTAPVEEAVTVVKQATPAPTTPSPAATKPSPTPPPTKATTPTTTLPAGPSPEVLKAQQVAALVGQADAAVANHNYDQAAGLYDQASKLDPTNAKASAGKASAQAIAASLKKSFVAGKTVVRSGKAAKQGPAGFDTDDVKLAQAPDYSGRIEFEISPAHVKGGDSYTVHVFVTNDGKKSFKIGSVSLTATANGAKTGGPATSAVKEVQPQQRAALADSGGVWTEGTTSWNLEVNIVSDHGDTFRNQLTWR
jgi:FHA domain